MFLKYIFKHFFAVIMPRIIINRRSFVVGVAEGLDLKANINSGLILIGIVKNQEGDEIKNESR